MNHATSDSNDDLETKPRKSLAAVVTSIAAVTAAIAVLAGLPMPTPTVFESVGTLSPSMIEMLDDVDDDDDDDESEPMTLAEVRKYVDAEITLTSRLSTTSLSTSTTTSGLDGSGIDVAVLDTGVAPVSGLDGKDKVLHGPDLSFEGSSPDAAYLDTYGHGTHMAAIIAGDRRGHEGIAPGARIVSVKLAGHDGLTTVPQVVAGIDWVIEHRNADGLNIRVLNLSLGQAGVPTHQGDMLSAAVERAWGAGIFVVFAAGNDGERQKHLDSPAIDPYVLAVGATDAFEEEVAPWSANGNGHRNPDLVAPGRSIASYRVPGSTIDRVAPHARYGDDLFLGSGTSQAAAVTSGAAALILQAQPKLSPDQLKATMTRSADDLEEEPAYRDGEGRLQARTAGTKLDISGSEQKHTSAFTGADFKASDESSWSGGTWSGGTWSGATWSGATWSGGTWSGATWSGATWSGATWSGATWSGGTWSGATWSGATWSGATWSGGTWSGGTWS